MKLCRKCGETKPISEFYKSTRGGCKSCVRTYQKQWYQAHRTLKKEPLPEGLRRCNRCEETKPVNKFYRDASNVSGYHHYCKNCVDKGKKERRARKQALKSECQVPGGFKQCTKCERILPHSEFYKLKSSKDGLRYRCKDCEREYKQSEAGKRSARAYAHKSEVKAQINARRKKQRQEGTANWVLNEEVYRTEYRKRDYVREKAVARNEEYRDRPENREKARETSKVWRQENPEKQREQSRIKYIRKKGAEGYHDPDQWQELLVLCDHKCLACVAEGKEVDGEELQRDHIHPLTKGGSDRITNVQPLCLKHNAKKHTQTTDHRPQHVREWAEEQREQDEKT